MVVVAPEASSAARRASADDSWAWAASTSSERAVVSTVASTWPAVTVWPALTLTAVTVPDTAKLRLAWLAGSIVPELATVCWIVPVLTDTVCVVTTRPVGVDEPDVSQYARPPAPASTTTAATMTSARLRRQNDLDSVCSSASSLSGSSWVRSTGSSTVVALLVMDAVQPSDFTTSRNPAVSQLGVPCKTPINTLAGELWSFGRTLSDGTAGTGRTPMVDAHTVSTAHRTPGDSRATPSRTPGSPGAGAASVRPTPRNHRRGRGRSRPPRSGPPERDAPGGRIRGLPALNGQTPHA